MKTIQCLIHKDRKPGAVLEFTDGSLKFVSSTGALVNVVRRDDGALVRPPKLSKKERVKARRVSALTDALHALQN